MKAKRRPRPRPLLTARELRQAEGQSAELAALVTLIRDALAVLRRERKQGA